MRIRLLALAASGEPEGDCPEVRAGAAPHDFPEFADREAVVGIVGSDDDDMVGMVVAHQLQGLEWPGQAEQRGKDGEGLHHGRILGWG